MTSQPDTDDVRVFQLPDGRTLSYAIYGSPSPTAPTIFYLHGFPSSHAEGRMIHRAGLARGIRIIAPDRPGAGQSTHQPDRRLVDWPADLLSLADHVAAQTFAIIGVSGGAPYTLACARVLPRERLRGAALVCGLYPTALGLAGMAMEGRGLLWIAPLPGATWLLSRLFNSVLTDTAQLESAMKRRPAPDRAVFESNEDNFRDNMIAGSLGATPDGAALEAHILGSAWGFELEGISLGHKRIVMWHGALDENVPVAMAHKAAALLGDAAELHVSDDEAHASLIVHKADEVVEVLQKFLA